MSIGPIGLQGDPLVPVMKGMGAFFGLKDFEPGVLPGRLIEMTVNGYERIFHLRGIYGDSIFKALSYITRSISKKFCTSPFLKFR